MGNEHTDAERLARLEAQIEALTQMMIRLEAKLDVREANFVSREILNEKLQTRDSRINNLEKEIKQMQDDKLNHKQILPGWAQFLAGLGTLIVAVLALYK